MLLLEEGLLLNVCKLLGKKPVRRESVGKEPVGRKKRAWLSVN